MKSEKGRSKKVHKKEVDKSKSILDLDSSSYKDESIFGITSMMNTQAESGMKVSQKKRSVRKHRRLKTELLNEEKNYKCGCGKCYLSYAALYTHTKVKHNGIFPEGTYAGEKRKQGRPKVGEFYSETDQCLDHQT